MNGTFTKAQGTKHNTQRAKQGHPPIPGETGGGLSHHNNIPPQNFPSFSTLLDFFDTDLCMCTYYIIGMKQAPLATLSQYEASIVRGTRNSRSDTIVGDRRTKAILDNMLKCVNIVELDDGTTVEATIEEILIAGAIGKELYEPKGLETVERLMKIRGELEDKNVEVNVSLVDKDLAKRALE